MLLVVLQSYLLYAAYDDAFICCFCSLVGANEGVPYTRPMMGEYCTLNGYLQKTRHRESIRRTDKENKFYISDHNRGGELAWSVKGLPVERKIVSFNLITDG